MATTRTLQFFGQVTEPGTTNPGIGTVTATLNGTTVFSGQVPALSSILFSCDVDMALAGSIPMTITIQGCDVYMGGILANYCNLGPDPANSTPGNDAYFSSGATGFLDTILNGDSRANVTCTGAAYCSPPPPEPRPEGAEGTWGWQVNVNPGSPATFSYDLQIAAGTN